MQTGGKLSSAITTDGKTKVIWHLPPVSSLSTEGELLSSACFLTSDAATWHLQVRRKGDYIQLFLRRQYSAKRPKDINVLTVFRCVQERGATEIDRTTRLLHFRPPVIISRGFAEAIPLKKTASSECYYVELEISPQGNGEESRRETGYVGLRNEGNTCYVNALLQTLFHLPCLRQAVFQIPPTVRLAADLQAVFYELMTSPQAVSARGLLTSLGTARNERQEDVQEFSLSFYEKLKVCMENSPVAGFLSTLFEGLTETVYRCKYVDFQSAPRVEEFLDLQLPVANLRDIYSSLKAIMSEDLHGEDQFDAETWGKQDAVREVRLRRLPPVLQLFLKRFRYQYGEIQKLNTKFEFPWTLDLSDYTLEAKPAKYQLFGVLVHKGVSYHGHYFAFLKVGLAQWYKFNDYSVDAVTEEHVLATSVGGEVRDIEVTENGVREVLRPNDTSAYMLYYVKEGEDSRVFDPTCVIPPHLKQSSPIFRSSTPPLSPELMQISTPTPTPTPTHITFRAPFLTIKQLGGWMGPGIFCTFEGSILPNDTQVTYMELKSYMTCSDLRKHLLALNAGVEVRIWLFYPVVSRWQLRAVKTDTVIHQVVNADKLTQVMLIETQNNRDIRTSGSAENTSDTETLPEDVPALSSPLYGLNGLLVFLKVYKCQWGQCDLSLCTAANINSDVVSVSDVHRYYCDLQPAWKNQPFTCFRLYLERNQPKTDLRESDCFLVVTPLLARKKTLGAELVCNGDALIAEMMEETVPSDYISADVYLKYLVYYTTVHFVPYQSEDERLFNLEAQDTPFTKISNFYIEMPKSARLHDVLKLLETRFQPIIPSLTTFSIGIFTYDSKFRKVARLPYPTDLADEGKNPPLQSLYTQKAIQYALEKPSRRESEEPSLSVSVHYIRANHEWDSKPLRREVTTSTTVRDLKLELFSEVEAMWSCEGYGSSSEGIDIYEHDKETKGYLRKLNPHVKVATVTDALLSVKVVLPAEKLSLDRKDTERVNLVCRVNDIYAAPRYLLVPVECR